MFDFGIVHAWDCTNIDIGYRWTLIRFRDATHAKVFGDFGSSSGPWHVEPLELQWAKEITRV